LGSPRHRAIGACCRREEIEQHRRRSPARKGGVLVGLSRGNGGPVGLRRWAGRRPRRPPPREGRQPRCPPSRLAGQEGGRGASLRSAEGKHREAATPAAAAATNRSAGGEIAPLDKMGVGLGMAIPPQLHPQASHAPGGRATAASPPPTRAPSERLNPRSLAAPTNKAKLLCDCSPSRARGL
jgi:hypothetical protein